MQIVKNQKGTTLVELLIGMVILVIILSPITNVIKTSFMAYQNSTSRSLTLTEGYAALNTISSELRYAQLPIAVINDNKGVEYTVLINDTLQNRRMYIGDGSTASKPNKTLIVESTDPSTGQISYRKIANGIISYQIENSNPAPIFTLNERTMQIKISLQDYSYTGSPVLNLNSAVVMSNI